MNARRPLLLLAACTSAQAAVGVFEDDMVSRPIDWNGLFSPHENLEDHTKVTSAVYGTGIAKGYVEKCATTSMPPEGHACYRVYLVLDPNVARNVYALYGSTYMDMTLKTESTDGHQPSNFYQAPPGMDVELGGVNPALYQFSPVAEFDSWFTIGADTGDTKAQLSVVGIGKFGNISSLTTGNGALFASDPASVPDDASKPTKLPADRIDDAVLIGQLTVLTGTEWTWTLNAQGKTSDSLSENTWQEHGICISNVHGDKGRTCGKHKTETKRTFLQKDEL